MIKEILDYLIPESLKAVSIPLVAAKIIGIVVIYILARLIIRLSMRAIQRADDAIKSYDLSPHGHRVLGHMVSFGVYFLALLFIFWMLGILPAIYTLLTAAGFIGIVVGFGLKEVLSNFVSGLIIAVEQPFKIDDEVEVKGFEGFVEDISIRMTTIKLWDGRVVYIPNSIMLTEPVINLRRSGRRQVEAEVVLDGRADFNRTIEVIKEVFGKEKLVLGKPEPFVIVDRIAPNEIKLKLRFWFDVSKTDYQTIKSSVMEAVKRNLA